MDEPLFKRITENTFEAGPSGGSGAISYGTPYGTPQGGNTTQNPVNFTSSDKTVNHINNQISSSAVLKGTLPGKPNTVPTKKEPSKALGEPAPAAKAQQLASQKPLNPDDAYGADVDKMFKKKNTPSPDEIMSALQYELSQMVKKDKTIAKRVVLQNLQQDPQYYSRLGMLNIDDKKMKVDESTYEKTKTLLDEMIAERQKRIAPPPPNLDVIMKEMQEKRRGIKSKE